MRRSFAASKAIVLLLAIILAGCASAISKGALESVDRTVRFEDVLANPELHRGKRVVLGGEIAGIENESGKTVILVIQAPLNRRLRPVDIERSQGRFILVFKGFKDPAIYGPGRVITVAGVVTGSETGRIGRTNYRYPVIEPFELYLWRQNDPADGPAVGFGFGIGIIHTD